MLSEIKYIKNLWVFFEGYKKSKFQLYLMIRNCNFNNCTDTVFTKALTVCHSKS